MTLQSGRESAVESRLSSRSSAVMRAAKTVWAAQPASVVIAGLQLVGFIVFAVVVHPSGFHLHGPTEGPSRLFVIRQPVEATIGVVATLVLVGASERVFGALRSIVAYAVACGMAALSSVVIHLVVTGMFTTHTAAGFRVAFVPTYAPAVGTILAASAFAGALWRRRIRVVSLAACAAFVLFEGNFSGLVTLAVALTGLLVGLVLRNGRRIRRVEWVRSSHHETRVLLSLVVAVSAGGLLASVWGSNPVGPLGALGSLFRDPLPARGMSLACRMADAGRDGRFVLSPFGPCTAALARQGLHGPAVLAVGVAPLILLLITAFYIRRGLRAAAMTAIVVNIVLSAAAVVRLILLPDRASGHVGPLHAAHVLLTATSAIIPLAIAGLLVAKRRHAVIASSRRSVVVGAVMLSASALILVGGYVAAGLIDEDSLQQSTSVGALAITGVLRLVPFGFSGIDHLGTVPIAGLSRVLFTNMGWVFWLVVIAAVLVMCRHRAGHATRSQLERLRALLHRGGGGPLSHMATWDGNQVWFDPEARGAVAYRLVGDVAITLGDPICEPTNTGSVVAAFSIWCDDQGYLPVFYSASSTLRPLFAGIGWYDLPVGEETVIRPQTFSMQGKKWQDVRSSVNRAAKADLRVVWTRFADLEPSWSRQIADISEQWVADKKLPEMGFTLGGLPELRDAEVRLMLAVSADGRVDAVTSWLPTYRDGIAVGRTLDFMRRRPDSMNGVMEFVIASAILQAREDDLEFLSLSAAPLVSTNPSTTPIDNIMEFLSRSLEPAYGFRSLFAFKRKFQPDYQELIMAYPDPLLLPRIGAALTRAYLPDLAPRHIAHLVRRTP